MGLFSRSSSSSSSTAYTTNNIDKRLVVGEDGLGVSADGSNVTLNVERLDDELVSKALDFASAANAVTKEGTIEVLSAGRDMFANMANRVSDAYAKAQNDAKGALEQKTVVLVALVAVVPLAILFYRRGKK